jgi:protein gp37
MADKSAIEWTDATWNPIRARNKKTGKVGWHCEHATTGCEFCYAEGFNKRLGTGLDFKPGHRKDIEIFLDEAMLMQPLRWKKPRMIFVGSMTDLFADFVPDEWIDKVFAVMALSPQHTFQVLTKRAKRMNDWSARRYGQYSNGAQLAIYHTLAGRGSMAQPLGFGLKDTDVAACMARVIEPRGWPLPNVWLGVSTERQQEADERIPFLLATPAAKRFISAEPLLGHIDLHALNLATPSPSDALRGMRCIPDDGPDGYHNEPTNKLDWVIAGGESGPKARPMHPEWARSLRDWCKATGVAFFFKQWGEWAPRTREEAGGEPRAGYCHPEGRDAKWPSPEGLCEYGPFWLEEHGFAHVARVGKKAAGRHLDGKLHDAMPARDTR